MNENIDQQPQNMNNNQQKNKSSRYLPLLSIQDAYARKSIAKNLFSHDNLDSASPHAHLFRVVAAHLINCDEFRSTSSNCSDTFYSQNLCFFTQFMNYVDPSVYQGNARLQQFVSNLTASAQQDNNDANNNIPILHLKIVDALINCFNLNILNYSVYVDKKIVSKYRLFDILETVVFTQIFPSESCPNKLTLKKQLATEIDELKRKLIEERRAQRGNGATQQSASSSRKKKQNASTSTVDETQQQQQ